MIFRFTEEEQSIIREFEQKAREEHPNIEEIFENAIEDITQDGEELIIKAEKNPQKEQIADDIRIKFNALIVQMEQSRFKRLKTQKQILENAEETIKEAIVFTYNFLNLPMVESPANYSGPIVINGFRYKNFNYCNYIFAQSSQALFDCAIDKDLKI